MNQIENVRLHVYKVMADEVIKKCFFPPWIRKLICLFSKITLCTASIGVMSTLSNLSTNWLQQIELHKGKLMGIHSWYETLM